MTRGGATSLPQAAAESKTQQQSHKNVAPVCDLRNSLRQCGWRCTPDLERHD
jgi:hypothetical protein